MKLVDIKTVSEQTGLTVISIRKMVRKGELPHLQLGDPTTKKGKYLFDMDKINNTLEEKMMGNYKI
ncbi:MAG TPA: hypothetical protein VM577_07365 [Anaerovoracaceae bacterium]|nr:hypothetical protein [Anaerovoracaceae bacterium]